jgi:hypothetical protein
VTPKEQHPAVIQDIAAYFGANSEPHLASPDAGRAGADEVAQVDVQDDVNEFFGVEGS